MTPTPTPTPRAAAVTAAVLRALELAAELLPVTVWGVVDAPPATRPQEWERLRGCPLNCVDLAPNT